MSAKPVIFLSFANDRANPGRFLTALEPEKNEIQSILIDFQKGGNGIVYTIGSAQIDHILTDLNKFSNQLIIFHFSGHAGGEQLEFEDRKGLSNSLNKRNLAHILASEKRLKLVFLNGCATMGHLEQLQKAGIPAVIATSRSIPDDLAKIFATQFYKALVAGNTLEQSYLKAKTAILPDANEDFISRDIVFKSFEKEKIDQSLWGLYLSDKDIGNWTLKDETPSDILPSQRTRVNRYVTILVLYLLFTILGWFWGQNPMTDFGAQMEILCDRVAFQYVGNSPLFQNLDVKSVAISNFNSINVPSDSFLNLNESERFPVTTRGKMVLQPIPDLENSYVEMNALGIASIRFPDSSDVVINTPERDINGFQLDVELKTKSELSGRVYAGDTLTLQTIPNPVRTIDNSGLEEDHFDGIHWALYPVNQEVEMSGQYGINSFFFQVEKETDLELANLKGLKLSFEKLYNEQKISSVIKGTISFIEKAEPYKEYLVTERDPLLLEHDSPLTIQAVKILDEGIQLQISGRLNHLYAGTDGLLQNPTRLTWWWNNRRVAFIFLVLGFFILAGGIPFWKPLTKSFQKKKARK